MGAGEPQPVDVRTVLQAARRHVWVTAPEGSVRLRVRGGVDLVPGDRVPVEPGGAVGRRLERTATLIRRTHRGDQVLAGNVEALAIVAAAGVPEGGEGMIARCIAAARVEGIAPVILLNKADLDTAGALEARCEGYRRLGFEALVVSAKTGQGLEDVRARFSGRTVALVGASGVGKSTLINALFPEAAQATGDVGFGGRGRHTTSLARAIPWREGLLIDLPGVRSFGLVDAGELDGAFPDVAELAEGCRFANCAHRTEPDCAVRAAVEADALSPERLEVYQRIRESVARGEEGGSRRSL